MKQCRSMVTSFMDEITKGADQRSINLLKYRGGTKINKNDDYDGSVCPTAEETGYLVEKKVEKWSYRCTSLQTIFC